MFLKTLKNQTLFLTGFFLFSASVFGQWHSVNFEVMGTGARVELWHPDSKAGKDLVNQVQNEMHRIDALMSVYKPDSELSRLNRSADKQPVIISKELFDLLTLSFDYSRKTQGAFDITYASVGYLYNYREKKAPQEKEINQKIRLINYKNVKLDSKNRSVYYNESGVKIDLGGIAKGYAVDRCIELLQQAGVSNAFVQAGGDSRLLGDKKGRLWTIGIRHPRKEGEVITKVPLSDVAISTSGDYERFFMDNGERIHHIIDPTSGLSAKKSISVSVIASNAVDTDALSTSVFVLGPEKGLELINSLPDVSAIIIDHQGKFVYSDDLMSQ